MGNTILGKRSRSFYKGFNQRQVDYIKQKFSSISKNGYLDKDLFISAYKLNKKVAYQFYKYIDFDQSNNVDEYQFLCAIYSLCNMTVSQISEKIYDVLTNNGKLQLKIKQLQPFTEICLKYNGYLQKKQPTSQEIKKSNTNKFKKYDYDKNGFIDKQQFKKICTKDQDYKKWLFNMGFITKNQIKFNDQIYDLIDSDMQGQIQKHLNQTNPNIDKIKRGIQHRIQDDQFQVTQNVGQQSIPIKKPWEQEILKSKISIDKSKQNPNSPSQSLTINYVFGYRSHDCRNNVKFDSNNNVIYHQGNLGIVMNKNTKQQIYINDHKDDISCLQVIDNLAVTGQMGSKPSVMIWKTNQIIRKTQNVQTFIKPQRIITHQLIQSIANVTLSKSKALLAVSCNNSDHRLVIYDLKKLQKASQNITSTQTGVIAFGNLSKNIILDLKFAVNQKMLVAVTLKQILFIYYQNSTLKVNRGQFNNFSNSPSLCLVPLQNKDTNYMLTGMANGSIYFWNEQKCVKAVCGHQGSVSALTSRKQANSFVSGDKTGRVIVWSSNFQKQLILNVPKTNSPSCMIISLSMNKKDLLIGTKSSKVYQINISKDKQINQQNCIITGHSQGHISGLAVQQSQNDYFFYTGGQDQRLIKWEYGKVNRLVDQKKLKYAIKSLDFNSKSKILVVGYKNGIIELFDSNLLSKGSLFNQIKNPDQQVLTFLKFNLFGTEIFASYCHPKYSMKFFSITDGKIKLIKDKQIQEKSKIISADMDMQNRYLRINTKDLQYFVYNIQGRPIKQKLSQKRKQIQTIKWHTHSTIMSPQTQGFKTDGVSEQDIICCQRSRKNRNVILIGDKYSKIKLFNYPCKNYPIFNKYTGHSNQVTAIQFNKQQNYVISIGGQEKSIIVWKYDPDEIKNKQFFQEQEQPIEDQLKKAVGQQKLATLAFKGQIKQPSDYKQKYNPKKDNQLPKQNISIKHVFGLRNQYINDQIRNQCKFTSDYQHIVFPTACLGVKMNIKSKQQQFYHQHKQDIVSFAIDSQRKLMATGQMAEKNLMNHKKKILSIYVWDIDNKKFLKKLDGFHTIAVVLLSFSPNSKLLFTVGNDDKNSFAVYDWKAGSILYSGPVSRGKVNAISWKSQDQFMTVGMDHVKIWNNGKGKQGKFSDKPEAMFSCASSNSIYITGSGSGKIYNWSGSSSGKPINAHNGKVQTILIRGQKVFTGADDGKILIWKKSANGQIQRFQQLVDTRDILKRLRNIEQISQEQFGVLSLDCNLSDSRSKNNLILVGTKGAHIIYFSQSNIKQCEIVQQGHYKEQLWGLATTYNKNIFITGGDDKTVRLWDIDKKQQINRAKFDYRIRALDWQPSNQNRVVIADSRARIYLYDKNLQKQFDMYLGKPFKNNEKDKIQPFVQQIKFSPNSQIIAYGTHGKSEVLEFLKINNNKNKLQLMKDFKGGSSALLHIDWSMDSSSIAINTQAYEYMFFSLNGTQVSASSLKDEKWSTWTRKLGFQAQGVFQGVDFTDVNTVCRSPSKQFMAVGYDDQTIKLFKYPCYIQKQVSKTFYGHSSHVTRIRFTQDYMISLGGNDRTIIVWNIDEQKKNNQKLKSGYESDDGIDDLEDQIDLPVKAVTRKKKKQVVQEFYQAADEGDEFMAVKPWLGAIKQPTYKFPKPSSVKPNVQIQLQYVFGYRSKDCRQNLFYIDSNTLLFHAAAVLIYHNINQNKQKILAEHNDDILSIDFHKSAGRVLTGQLGPKPLLNLYEKGKLINSFKAPVSKGIIGVSISPNGKLGVCVGIDQDHHVAILDLQNYAVLDKQKSGKKVVTKVKWINDKSFVTIGINHFKFWKFQGKKATSKQASQKGNFVSIDAKQNLILTGSGNGTLHSWKQADVNQTIYLIINPQAKQEQQIKAGVIQCIKIMDKFVACGTKDGYLFILEKNNLDKYKMINVKKQIQDQQQLSSLNPAIRAIDFIQDKLVIGTLGSQIYEMKLQKNNSQLDSQSITNVLKCHYSPNNNWTNEVWGLCISGDSIFTCSDDGSVRQWSLASRKLQSCISLIQGQVDIKNFPQDARARAIAISPEQNCIVVGSKDGTVRIFEFDKNKSELKINPTALKVFKPSKQQISQIKFGFKTLLIGSHDNAIYVYDFQFQKNQNNQKVLNLKRKYKPLKKHSSYITHFDISRDSCFIQSTCGAYQLLFWDLNAGHQITSGATLLKDQRWSTFSCNLGWPVQGIYPKFTDGTFINSVDRSNFTIKNNKWKTDSTQFQLLAVGNDNGKVCIYNYPSIIKSSNFVQGKGHSSHVTKVKWNQDDKYLVSTGGQDQCVMIWKVKKN